MQSFVRQIVAMLDNAVARYSIPIPAESPIGGRDTEEMALNGSEISTAKFSGLRRTDLRTFRWEVRI